MAEWGDVDDPLSKLAADDGYFVEDVADAKQETVEKPALVMAGAEDHLAMPDASRLHFGGKAGTKKKHHHHRHAEKEKKAEQAEKEAEKEAEKAVEAAEEAEVKQAEKQVASIDALLADMDAAPATTGGGMFDDPADAAAAVASPLLVASSNREKAPTFALDDSKVDEVVTEEALTGIAALGRDGTKVPTSSLFGEDTTATARTTADELLDLGSDEALDRLLAATEDAPSAAQAAAAAPSDSVDDAAKAIAALNVAHSTAAADVDDLFSMVDTTTTSTASASGKFDIASYIAEQGNDSGGGLFD